jgi:hypothetical protein
VEQEHQYYVEMPCSPCMINDVEVAQLLINLTNLNPNLQEEIPSSPNLTYEVMKFHNLLSLPHLLAKINNREKTISGLVTISCCHFN